MSTKRVRVPLIERGFIQSDFAVQRLPCSNQCTRERRFARTARADDGHSRAAGELETYIEYGRLWRAWRSYRQSLDRQPRLGPGQFHGLDRALKRIEHRLELKIAIS